PWPRRSRNGKKSGCWKGRLTRSRNLWTFLGLKCSGFRDSRRGRGDSLFLRSALARKLLGLCVGSAPADRQLRRVREEFSASGRHPGSSEEAEFPHANSVGGRDRPPLMWEETNVHDTASAGFAVRDRHGVRRGGPGRASEGRSQEG